MNKKFFFLFALIAIGVIGCSKDDQQGAGMSASAPSETAEEFVARANAEYADLWVELSAADWIRSTYITTDTAVISSLANEKYAEWHTNMVAQAVQYDDQELDPKTRRAINLLKLGTSKPAPDDPAKRKELTQIATDLKGEYGAGEYCDSANECRSLPELENVLAESRDYDELLDVWAGWRTVSPPMRARYQRFVELANEGASELGYGDLGEMWRSGYDMTPTEFEAEATRLWQQVKPLYDELHCHVRAKLGEVYGEDKVPQDGPIPAHLLGNMWSQTWGFIYDLMEPYPGVAGLDVDSTLKAKDYAPREMVRSAESFYVSLGMDRLPETFWERSMFSKPADRDVVCHASAWTLDAADDLRIKMCIKQTYDELRVIYHELGHNYYQWAYKDQPPLFWGGAHAGFHEAIGDTVTLSMTPEYLAEVGLLASAEQSREAVINRQMMQALDKIAFLPFGKLIDEWRWGVFSGAISPENYNAAWWDLRTKYQGIEPPVERTEADFDPGAKYHIPANVSYTRYFLARILQFQFQRALCAVAGHEGELQACSIYGSKEAGERFWAMLESGTSEPWQDTLEKLTGTREMDASAIIDYFEPLMGYLKEQNEGRSCGW
ncbi:MAG: M2 family metallopeptidase [Gammaproteobacteria bacterium]|nr:M2 family metallopeptidase [Gammaproteobacteria bacterium]